MRRRLFALVTVAGLFGAAEGVARVSGSRLLPARRSLDAMPGEPVPAEPNMVSDAATGWRPRTGRQRSFGIPDGTTVNSRGLRGPELPLEKGDARRVMFVGDSTVFGVLVRDSETFAREAEKRLRERDPRIEVLNAGAPGWSSFQALRALDARLLDYEPDLLVVATLWSDTQGGPADADRFAGSMGPLEASFAFVLLREWVRAARWGDAVEEVRVDLRDAAPPTPRVPLDDYRANLEAMAERMDGRVAYLVLPCNRDPAGGEVGDFRDGYRDAMRATATKLGVPLADAPPAFVGGDTQRLFRDEVHPSAEGHRKVAEVVVKALDGWARGRVSP